jgi:hypothetical protein
MHIVSAYKLGPLEIPSVVYGTFRSGVADYVIFLTTLYDIMSHNIAQNVCQVEYGFSFRSLKFYKCCFRNYCFLDLSRQNPPGGTTTSQLK